MEWTRVVREVTWKETGTRGCKGQVMEALSTKVMDSKLSREESEDVREKMEDPLRLTDYWTGGPSLMLGVSLREEREELSGKGKEE